MKKKISVVVVLTLITTLLLGATTQTYSKEEELISTQEIVCERPIEDEIVETSNREELKTLIKKYSNKRESAHQMAESARELGYTEDSYIVETAREEWHNADELLKYYQTQYDNLPDEKYPVASTIWKYLKAQGYSDIVCAGIMGNMMVESGGLTLNIQPTVKGQGHYGICQWSKRYYPSIWGTNLETQLKFLTSDIAIQFNTYGYLYKKGFNYNSFLQINSINEATTAFLKCYERGATGTLSKRQQCALTAYNYFS